MERPPRILGVCESNRRLVAAVCEDELWIVRPGSEPKKWPLLGATSYLAFSPDGERLAVAGHKSQLWILRVKDGSVQSKTMILGLLGLPRLRAYSMDWSPNGKWLGVLAGEGIDPFILDGTDGTILWEGGPCGGQMGCVFECAWTAETNSCMGFRIPEW